MAFVAYDLVKETSTSSGTGNITVAGAMTGHVSFAAKCSVGDTFFGCMRAVDAIGIPTGEWEIGFWTYSAANTLTRTSLLSSSTGAAVSFSVGTTKHVYMTMPAVQVAWARERLTANRTYYVRTDGSDSNSGLANTSGGAFLTIQKAIDTASGTLDLAGYTMTVQVADGTYTGATSLKALIGGGSLVIQGNSGTPANVVISTTSSHCFTQAPGAWGAYTIKDLKMQTTTSGFALVVSGSGSLLLINNVVFGTCASGHMYVDKDGNITAAANYAISGAATVHYQISTGGSVACNSKVITITGTPAFSTAYLYATTCGMASLGGTTYSGSATGVRYSISLNAVADTGGATLPGGTAGSTATGGQYA